jgi:cell division protein FtsA
VAVTGVGAQPSTGVRKGQVIDLDHAISGIRTAVQQAAKASGVDIRKVLLAVSGGHVESLVSPGQVTIQARDRVVTHEDVEEAIEVARSAPIGENRCALHTLSQNYTVDGQPGIVKPEGMRGANLAVSMLIVHALRTRIDNAIDAARGAELDVQDAAFGGICASLAVVSPEQKRNGVLLLDLGGGTTDYVAYVDNTVAAVGSIALGGDHVTNDLALAFDIPIQQAEEIKRREGAALIDPEAGLRRVSLPQTMGFGERSASLRALQTVVNARMDETLTLVRGRVDEAGLLPHLGAGVVLTGGGAYLRRLPDLVQRIFGRPCAIGTVRNVDGLQGVEQPAALATAAGLALYGFRSAERGGGGGMQLGEWFWGLIGKR